LARRTRHERDAAHKAATVRAASSVAVDWRLIACGRIDNGVGLVGRGRGFAGDQPPAAGEVVVAIAIGEEAVVADAVEAVRQRVEKKAADELGGVERHHFGDAIFAVILPGEADLAGFKREQPAVGDGDTMRVTAEIGERLARAAERRLGIDHPSDRKAQERRMSMQF
jgi:hypothetical protein